MWVFYEDFYKNPGNQRGRAREDTITCVSADGKYAFLRCKNEKISVSRLYSKEELKDLFDETSIKKGDLVACNYWGGLQLHIAEKDATSLYVHLRNPANNSVSRVEMQYCFLAAKKET